ncbi:hypothetical protein SAMN05216490_3841 [Mucilaginibacter mallensis]|uniref:Uncharacterized protein n=1 Tax=Mucilaginibacter mallensis TaxID=652787 RepID=A0A1H2B0S2_MUCMA|nr:hypothetical protein SAMN05216490_3841 [Mucilaginibacter mallensis]
MVFKKTFISLFKSYLMNNRLIIVNNNSANYRAVFPIGNTLADQFDRIQK